MTSYVVTEVSADPVHSNYPLMITRSTARMRYRLRIDHGARKYWHRVYADTGCGNSAYVYVTLRGEHVSVGDHNALSDQLQSLGDGETRDIAALDIRVTQHYQHYGASTGEPTFKDFCAPGEYPRSE